MSQAEHPCPLESFVKKERKNCILHLFSVLNRLHMHLASSGGTFSPLGVWTHCRVPKQTILTEMTSTASAQTGLFSPVVFFFFFLSLCPCSFFLPSFNLLSFAKDLKPWQNTLVETTDAACHEAMHWVTHLQAQGNTAFLSALMASAASDPPPHPVALQKQCHPTPVAHGALGLAACSFVSSS